MNSFCIVMGIFVLITVSFGRESRLLLDSPSTLCPMVRCADPCSPLFNPCTSSQQCIVRSLPQSCCPTAKCSAEGNNVAPGQCPAVLCLWLVDPCSVTTCDADTQCAVTNCGDTTPGYGVCKDICGCARCT
eukprot:250881_1